MSQRNNERTETTVEEGKEITTDALMKMVFASDLKEDASIVCGVSGERITPDKCELVHLVPLSAGGTHTIDNVLWASKEINRMMGQMTYDRFVEICRAVVRVADQRKA